MNKLTPMFCQFEQIKKQCPDCILFFRVGDFYETYGEDAVISSRILGITLTSRQASPEVRYPMAGVPYHAVEPYLAKLLNAGKKVAICEQVEDPKLAKGLVKREIIKVVTPGTLVGEEFLLQDQNNFILALSYFRSQWGVAYADISTGDFFTTTFSAEKEDVLQNEIMRISPSEILLKENSIEHKLKDFFLQHSFNLTFLGEEYFNLEDNYQLLLDHFQTNTLKGFGCQNLPPSIISAGVLLRYVKETQKISDVKLRPLSTYFNSEFMFIDESTQKNLELVKNLRDGTKKGTLLEVLDKTKTALGARLLRQWILKPLLNLDEIEKRQNIIEVFKEDTSLRSNLREKLSLVKDIERLIMKVTFKTINARELISLSATLEILPEIKQLLFNNPKLSEMAIGIQDTSPICKLINSAILDEPPFSLREGGIIRKGYSSEVDELRDIKEKGTSWLIELERRERERTGIKSLKIKYNKLFGYFIEVTKANLHLVPPDYIRKQTLVSTERFITEELKRYEERVLTAQEKLRDLEYALFCEVRDKVAQYGGQLLATAKIVAQIDVYSTLAEVAVLYDYVKPKVHQGLEIIIKDGRHPVVEKILGEGVFVPNDTEITRQKRFYIITGPNMAGKSTYLRQVGLMIIMAQMGSFIPAREAYIGLVDRVFTRVGAFDDLLLGQSTFLTEMSEVANIVNNASERSLVLLDEIGRGTSTFDGLSIAWAVGEYIYNVLKSRTLFATHFHELTQLGSRFQGIINLKVSLHEEGNKILFDRKLKPGAMDKSYGVKVARLAGLPYVVLKRAEEILKELEDRSPRVYKRKAQLVLVPFPSKREEGYSNGLVEELKKLDINQLTPLNALEKLAELKGKILKEGDLHE